MQLLTPLKALNKAFLKQKSARADIDVLARALPPLLGEIKTEESEEYYKNLLSHFLRNIGYEGRHFINTHGDTDLVIHHGPTRQADVAVLIEVKRPNNRVEMIGRKGWNCKAFQELLLYFLDARTENNGFELRNLVVTNIIDWYVFDAQLFERLFYRDTSLLRAHRDFRAGRLSGTTTDFFYREIASPAIANAEDQICATHFDLTSYKNGGVRKYVELHKILSPTHLLKLPFANDSNSLDAAFYSELLHIIGLEERREGAKKLILRKDAGSRDPGSLLENTISEISALDKINRVKNPQRFGQVREERLFNIALELVITWVNRVLFLKLLEAQLVTFRRDPGWAFLNSAKIASYGELNALFFRVLAVPFNERKGSDQSRFGPIPYLNSSLFEPTELEHDVFNIGALDRDLTLKCHPKTILRDERDRKLAGQVGSLEYLLRFLASYDFGSSGSDEVKDDDKPLISASVLGLIFEKINGYKDGSFFTPGFVTMYMTRVAIVGAVFQKFLEAKGWNCQSLDELYNRIDDVEEANRVVDSLRICDPAVGSGHFLVSSLNELIALKSELRILRDRHGRLLKEYRVQVVNDELHVFDEEGALFDYRPGSRESQRVQEALFHEKQRLIEGCLFGVDVNPNSVKICRLRLWIELLKSAYYRQGEELETLPNIDINIKVGDSLVARFPLDADLRRPLKRAGRGIAEYRSAVDTYRNATSKAQKHEMEAIIDAIKTDLKHEIASNDPLIIRLRQIDGRLATLERQQDLFSEDDGAQLAREAEERRLTREQQRIRSVMESVQDARIFVNAFEWRIEFPEVLDDKGEYHGFDLMIGNPPYGLSIKGDARNHLLETLGKVPDFEIYYWFIDRAKQLLKPRGILSFIVPNTVLFNVNARNYRSKLLDDWCLHELLDCTDIPIFTDATVRNVIITGKRGVSEQIGYRQTSEVSGFDDLVGRPRSCLPRTQFEVQIQNWALLFKLSPETLSAIEEIRSGAVPLSRFFPETSQGLIAYDKYQGQDKATITSRKYHSRIKHGADWKPWLRGEDVKRYAVTWNGQEYIKYGIGIANPRDPKFFVGRRALIREITNPTIYAAIATEELYNDPSVLVVKDSGSTPLSLEVLIAILNSKLGTFYHFNSSPKATKGAFPKILVTDINQFPLPAVPKAACVRMIEKLSRRIQQAIATGRSPDLSDEAALDRAVCALYALSPATTELVLGAS
ncbi:Eco57I restriction-modification methylase domain-containing protein [Aquabacterium sp.]|uniref:type IIG restriction enzyme/methyltransferase n=1 Tax=Aquabacterium sp. TaxID=1872578 RepID=UPI003783CB08